MANKPGARILIIEDDIVLGASLCSYLVRRGYKVTLFENGSRFEEIDISKFDLLVLDLILPGEIPGEDILLRVKQRFPNFPVIILSGRHAIEAKEKCFNRGADDYLTKPFNLLELELRIKALLRRFQRDEIIHVQDVQIDLGRKLLTRNGVEIRLSARSWDLLQFLIRNRGRVVEKEEIMENVWKDTHVSEDCIRAYIRELRKVLSSDSIVTYKGRGYRLL